MRPAATVLSTLGRRTRYVVRWTRRGGGGGNPPAPKAVGGHRGGGTRCALSSVLTWSSSVAVIARVCRGSLSWGRLARRRKAVRRPSALRQSTTPRFMLGSRLLIHSPRATA